MRKPNYLHRVLVSHSRKGFTDGVEVAEVKDVLSLYRYIEDWDDEGDTIYAIDEFLINIPGPVIRQALGVDSNEQVFAWLKKSLIKKQSNAIDAIQDYLDKNGIPYEYTNDITKTVFNR